MSFKNWLNKTFNGKYKRHILLFAFDICFFITAFLLDLLLFYFTKRNSYIDVDTILKTFAIVMAIQCFYFVIFRFLFSVYKNIWRYTNTRAYLYLIIADLCACFFTMFTVFIFDCFYDNEEISIYSDILIISAFALIFSLLSRTSYARLYERFSKTDSARIKLPVAIVGAGRLGTYLAGDLRNNPKSDYYPLFFIDKNENKIGKFVAGIKVYDFKTARSQILNHGIGTVIIAISSTTRDNLANLYSEYSSLNCKVRIYESLFSEENPDIDNKFATLRDFTIEDLLFRKPIEINDHKSLEYYKNKVVLVTGGGGSIGSELCRQLAKCSLKKLIIFDIYENNAYDIQQELKRKYGDALDFCVEIGSVRDRKRLDDVFSFYRPDVVFHAAAHKHVPLMEHSSGESIKNNVVGTYNTADFAEKYGVKKFILISTDKAVNPTSIMGATKRICEMIIQSRIDSKTCFSAVRFGNVLGSNGSVIPLFKNQIKEGGPVTITDKRIIRYFMTIAEAAQLVIESGAMAKSGDLFALDMGNPVKIYDLACNMIKLMGLVPNVDIEIKEVGLRPGEKLYEELLMKTENLDKTDNKLIFIERDTPYTRVEIDEKLRILNAAVESIDGVDVTPVKQAIKDVVPTFHNADEMNKTASESEEMQRVMGHNKEESATDGSEVVA